MEEIRNATLARFDEMVEDLRRQLGDEIYPEASQHAEDGSLVLDPDDELPCRVDVVTPEGEEYQLERGDPVAPGSVAEFEEYPFKVKLHPGTWDALAIQVKFEEPLSEGQWEDLLVLLRSWFLCGFWGGYGGYLHEIESMSYGGKSLKCVVDLGSAEVEAVHALLRAVASFGEEMAPVEKVTLGEAPAPV